MQLDQIPVTGLKGVSSKLAEKLRHLHLQTVQDLLFHLPLRYEDRTLLCPIAELLISITSPLKRRPGNASILNSA